MNLIKRFKKNELTRSYESCWCNEWKAQRTFAKLIKTFAHSLKYL